MVEEEHAKEYTTIFNRTVEVENTSRPLEEFRLDPTNPRIAHKLAVKEASGETLTEPEIEKHLWSSEEVKRLYRAIIASGGLSEPPYIMPDGRVVEGNERVVALRKVKEGLKDESYTEDKKEDLESLIKNVPCKVFPSDLTQTEKEVFLTRIHVVGKHEWLAVNQARQIHKLHEESGLSVEEIKEILGKSKPWVYQKLRAYKWTKEYLEKYGYERVYDYSYFEELYRKRSRLKDVGFDVDDSERMEEFQKMVAEGVFDRAVQVRKLPKLLRNEETREKILHGEGDEALDRLPEVEPGEFSPRFRALENALRQFRKMTREDLEMIREHQAYRELLQNVKREAEEILEQMA